MPHTVIEEGEVARSAFAGVLGRSLHRFALTQEGGRWRALVILDV